MSRAERWAATTAILEQAREARGVDAPRFLERLEVASRRALAGLASASTKDAIERLGGEARPPRISCPDCGGEGRVDAGLGGRKRCVMCSGRGEMSRRHYQRICA